ncbi:MAG: response regulator, partial [Aestuariivirgaceae bacterium]
DVENRFQPEMPEAEPLPQAEERAAQASEPETSPEIEEIPPVAPDVNMAAEHQPPSPRPIGWKAIAPLAPPSPKPVPLRRKTHPEPVEPPAAARRVKILVVEDQEGVRMVATGFLTDFGYEVVEAADGIAALDILNQQDDIDLMFTDVVMPGGLNGFDLAQAAQQIRPDLRIVHTSGYPKGAMVHMEEPRLKDNIIMKPYRREELKRVIEDTLQKPAS